MTTERVDTTTGEIVLATPVMPANLFGGKPVDVITRAAEIATALAKVLADKKLTSNIQGKEYVRVEGWTLLGSMLGVFPVCVWSRRTTEPDGWEARVEARTINGALVGAAEAQCARDEATWEDRDDYALRSMAQTRATSKALRLPLGFVVTMAGFEATPAEEIPREGFTDRPRRTGTARKASGSALGNCPTHNIAFFQTPNMRSAAHRLENGGWCNKPATNTPAPGTDDTLNDGWDVETAVTKGTPNDQPR